jgi:branched-chain amino acid transport system permease protein
MDLQQLTLYASNTVTNFSIYCILALGISLVFGLTGLINFAHGELMAVGAFVTYVVAASGGLNYLLALVLAMAVVGALSVGLERTVFRPTLKRPINGFLISLGLILILQNGMLSVFGGTPKLLEPAVTGNLTVAGTRISAQAILTVAIAVACMFALLWMLERTRFGMMLRAAAVDRETASHMGVNVSRTVVVVFLISGALAGVAGVLIAGLYPVSPLMGSLYVLKAFAVAILGGLGSVRGAIVASLIVAVAETVVIAAGYVSWSVATSFALMAVVLLVRPTGIFAGAEARA